MSIFSVGLLIFVLPARLETSSPYCDAIAILIKNMTDMVTSIPSGMSTSEEVIQIFDPTQNARLCGLHSGLNPCSWCTYYDIILTKHLWLKVSDRYVNVEAEWRIYTSVNTPSLDQIMACRRDGTKPLSNQCGNIVYWTFDNKLHWNFNRNWNIFIQENAFENAVFPNGVNFVSVSMWYFSDTSTWANVHVNWIDPGAPLLTWFNFNSSMDK